MIGGCAVTCGFDTGNRPRRRPVEMALEGFRPGDRRVLPGAGGLDERDDDCFSRASRSAVRVGAYAGGAAGGRMVGGGASTAGPSEDGDG
jgi:hypothetical protein